MRVLVACEFSGIVREAFRHCGHDAWSCDLLPTEIAGQHIQGDVLKHLNEKWDLMIAHPPCTYLTNAGVRHLHEHVTSRNGKRTGVFGKARWEAMRDAALFFNRLQNAPIPQIAIENPIPHRYAREIIGTYSQLIQPWQFGHGEVKATCLWLKGLSPLEPTKIVEGRYARCHLQSPGIVGGRTRAQRRSITYQGVAEAMAEQWGRECVDSPAPKGYPGWKEGGK